MRRSCSRRRHGHHRQRGRKRRAN